MREWLSADVDVEPYLPATGFSRHRMKLVGAGLFVDVVHLRGQGPLDLLLLTVTKAERHHADAAPVNGGDDLQRVGRRARLDGHAPDSAGNGTDVELRPSHPFAW